MRYVYIFVTVLCTMLIAVCIHFTGMQLLIATIVSFMLADLLFVHQSK